MTELSKEEKDVKIAPTFREVQMKKIKVRIAIGVDEEENVFTYGIGGNTNEQQAIHWARDDSGSDNIFILEAELEIPEAKTVSATVERVK